MAGRIVITGLGPVSAIGIGREEFAAALREGRSGIHDVTAFDVETCRVKQAAEIIDLDVNRYLHTEKNYLDRNSALAFVAARLALDDSGFAPGESVTPRFGLCLGTAYGNVDSVQSFRDSLSEKGPKLVSPFLFQHTYNNTSAGLLAIEHTIRGVHANFCSGWAAGTEAILYALDCLRLGRADAILAGGAESLSEAVFRGMDSMGMGIVPGEGAALVMLEPEDLAGRRGARPLAALLGGASAGDLATSAELALKEAGLSASGVAMVLGPTPDPGLRRWPIEERIGHTLGASGALALAAAVVLAEDGKCAMVNCADPSGLCVSLILGKG